MEVSTPKTSFANGCYGISASFNLLTTSNLPYQVQA
jgi:hypothetical protein